MKISTTIIAAIGLAALSACDARTDDNAAMDVNMDANMAIDNMDMTTDPNMTDPNMAANGMMMNGADGMNATENAMATDMNTNDPDTNLANGM